MSISCMMHVWWNSPARGNDRLILLAIADEADDEGRNAFPSVRRLADKTKAHTATVLRSVIRLERAGEIEVIRPKHRGPGRVNKYRIIMQPIPSPGDIRRRYASDDDSGVARKMQPTKLSTTARNVDKTARKMPSELRASVRAYPSDPSIDPKDKSPNFHQTKDQAIKQGLGCVDCDSVGVVEGDDGLWGQCQVCGGAGFVEKAS